MKNLTLNTFCLFLLLFSANAYTFEEWTPSYCKKSDAITDPKLQQSVCVKPEVSEDVQQKYLGLLSITNKIIADEMNNNLKNMALLDLLEKKRDLIAMYPEIEPALADDKFPWHKRKEYSKNSDGSWNRKFALDGNYNKCFTKENKLLNDKATALGQEIPKMRKDFFDVTETTIPIKMKGGELYNLKAKSTKKSIHMANVLLGALAAEQQIKERPVLIKNIEDTNKRISKLEQLVQITPEYASSNRCVGHQGRNNAEKCAAAKSPEKLAALQTELTEKQTIISGLEFQKKITDDAVFKSPYYVDPANIGDDTGNWFSNLFESKEDKKIMGDFKASPLITKGVPALKRALNNKFGNNAVDDLFKSLSNTSNIQDSTPSPSTLAAVSIEEILLSNPDIYKFMDDLIKDEVVKNLTEVDESLEEICDHGEDFLFRIPQMVEKAEKLYLNLAGEQLPDGENLNPYLQAHQEAHCSLIDNQEKEKFFQHWLKEKGGENAMLYTQLAGGATLLGSYVAAGFGCGPCLYYAIGATAGFVGLGTADTMEKDTYADILTGLSQVSLADHDEAREMLTDARLGWSILGFDLLTAPFGLKAGQMIKVGKLVKQGKTILGKTEIAKNKDFLKSLVNGLPEDEYYKVVESIKALPIDIQEKISKDLLSFGSNLNGAERFSLIENTLKKYGVDFPDSKELNTIVLQSIDNDPKKVVELKVKYADYLKEQGVIPGSAEEATELRILGILESKGCAANICEKPLMSVEDTISETKRIKKENGCG